jgi:hypothetical protein
MAATRFALLLFTLLNVSYLMSSLVATRTPGFHLWWAIGVSCVIAGVLSVIIQQGMQVWFRRSRRNRFMTRSPSTSKNANSVKQVSYSLQMSRSGKTSQLQIDDSSTRSGKTFQIDTRSMTGKNKPPTHKHTPVFLVGQSTMLMMLGAIALMAGLAGHQIAIRLTRHRQALWGAWYFVYSIIGLICAITITFVIK